MKCPTATRATNVSNHSKRIYWLAPAISQMHRRPLLRLLVAREEEASRTNALLAGIDSRWFAIRFAGRGCLIEHPARHHDRAVGRQQLLSFQVLYRSHAFLQGRV